MARPERAVSHLGRRYPVRRSVWRPEEERLRLPTRAEVRGIAPQGDLWPSGTVPPIWDQGQEGSCTAHAWARAHEIERRRTQLAPMDPSRALLYDLERALDGVPLTDDAGSQMPDGGAVLMSDGNCDTATFPYTPANLTVAPDAAVLALAAAHRITGYARVPLDAGAIVAQLAVGRAVAFGIDVYESFESAQTMASGWIPLPQPGERLLGGHAMCLTGWDVTSEAHDHTGFFGWFEDRLYGMVPEDGWLWVDNSWGTGIGIGGRMKLPFAWLRSGYVYDPFVVLGAVG